MNININEISKEEIKQILIEQLAAEMLAEKRSKLMEPPTSDTNSQDTKIFEENIPDLDADEFNDDDVMEVTAQFLEKCANAKEIYVIEGTNKIIDLNGGRF